MANLNTLTTVDIRSLLLDYGFDYIDFHQGSLYFENDDRVVLKLTIGTTNYAEAYYTWDTTHWKSHVEVLPQSVVTDLNSLDQLLIPQYSNIDPVIFKSASLLNFKDYEILTYDSRNYFQSDIFLDSNNDEFKVSNKPSPYRNRDVLWVPVVLINTDWVLENNNSIIVPANQVVQDVTHGDFVIVIKTI
tara:strand:- start:2203 stop:2769 length:567 start_codon:yes stop_codon:yes gene_type:complete